MTRTLMRGGYVHTPADPHATALCLEDGQVTWTGDDDAAWQFVDGADQVIELQGRLVTPAFVDAHAHLAQTGLSALGVDLADAASAAETLDLIALYARSCTLPVILGHGWDESTWPDAAGFDGDALARVTGGKPAYITRVDMHSALVTGLAGRHGRVERDDHHAVRAALATHLTPGMRQEALRTALAAAAARGIGIVHELGAPHINPATDFALLEALRIEGGYPRTIRYWGSTDVDEAVALGCQGAAGDLCVDGAIGSHTAALHAPYTDDAATDGYLYLDAEQITAHVVACTQAGLQAGFHVIGDRAAAAVTDGFRRAAEQIGIPALVMARHRLEHAEMLDPNQVELLGSYGVTASVQPMFDALWGGPDGLYRKRLGGRAAGMNAFASMNRAGMALAFGSDSPVTPFDPWGAIRAAAWHHNPDERLTVRAAFNAHTRGGWRAAGHDEGGVIAVGAPATIAVFDVPGDLMVQTPDSRVAAWSTDVRAGVPHLPSVHPDQPLPSCVLTLVDGQVVYEKQGVLR